MKCLLSIMILLLSILWIRHNVLILVIELVKVVPNIHQLADLREGTVKSKLKKSCEKYKKFLDGLNDKVPPHIQKLFNELSKQYDCEWKDEKIIYIKDFNITISPPYLPENCGGDSNEKANERLKYILANFASMHS